MENTGLWNEWSKGVMGIAMYLWVCLKVMMVMVVVVGVGVIWCTLFVLLLLLLLLFLMALLIASSKLLNHDKQVRCCCYRRVNACLPESGLL